MTLELTAEEHDHLGDLRRKGLIPLGPDGLGVPCTVAIRLELAGLAEILAGEPQRVRITDAGRRHTLRGAW